MGWKERLVDVAVATGKRLAGVAGRRRGADRRSSPGARGPVATSHSASRGTAFRVHGVADECDRCARAAPRVGPARGGVDPGRSRSECLPCLRPAKISQCGDSASSLRLRRGGRPSEHYCLRLSGSIVTVAAWLGLSDTGITTGRADATVGCAGSTCALGRSGLPSVRDVMSAGRLSSHTTPGCSWSGGSRGSVRQGEYPGVAIGCHPGW